MAAFRFLSCFRSIALNNRAPCFKLLKVYSQQEPQQFFSLKSENSASTNESEKKKKTIPVPKITLISPDESIQVVSLLEAQKISKRRDLKLVKIIDLDTKTQRAIYKLMSGADYYAEDLKQREAKKEKKNDALKGEKLLLLSSKISEHDLESRIKNILKWINKRYEIRVVINSESAGIEPCEKIYCSIEDKLTADAKIVQKRAKNNELKFQILPLKIPKSKIAENL